MNYLTYVMVIYFCPNFFTSKWHFKMVQLNPRVFILHNGRPLSFRVSLTVLFNMLLFPNPPLCRTILIRFLWWLWTSKNMWKYANVKVKWKRTSWARFQCKAHVELLLRSPWALNYIATSMTLYFLVFWMVRHGWNLKCNDHGYISKNNDS